MRESSEVVLLLGAGASQALNIPAMGGMFEAFLGKSKPGISRSDRRICQLFVDKLGVKRDLEEFLLAANEIVDSQRHSLAKLNERIVSPSLKGKTLEKHRAKLRQYVSDIKVTRMHMLDFMYKTCFQFDRDRACDLLTGFVEMVSGQGYPVYTTNYDFALEYVAADKGIPIEDNFVSQGQRYIWNPEIRFPLGEALTIVKLHGSVTWYSDDSNVIEKFESYTTLSPAGRPVKRLVVFPTRFKDIYDQNFFALYSHFLTALSAAKCLVVIGHSLRDEYLRAAIIERFRKKGFHIVVVDPQWPQTLPQEFRPAKVGTAGALTHIPCKFEDFSDELAQVLQNCAADAIGEATAAVVRQMRFKKNKLKVKGKIGVLRPGVAKELVVSIDAYIYRHRRPVHIRAWIEAESLAPSGEPTRKISRLFANSADGAVRLGLSGIVKEEVRMRIKVPTLAAEPHEGIKMVKLRVALVEESQRGPLSLKPEAVIAEDSRDVTLAT